MFLTDSCLAFHTFFLLQISANEDDLGLGGNAQSLIDGNSGPGVAWSIIGIHADSPALATLATDLPTVDGTVNAVAAMAGSVSGSVSFAQTVRCWADGDVTLTSLCRLSAESRRLPCQSRSRSVG
jgi:hypothetical protein